MRITGIAVHTVELPYVDARTRWTPRSKHHGYAKAAFDAACWNLVGQATDRPVWMLLDGKLTDGAPMYRVAHSARPTRRWPS